MHVERLSVLAIVSLQPAAVALFDVERPIVGGRLLVALVRVEVVEGQREVDGCGLSCFLGGRVELADLGEANMHSQGENQCE